MTAARGLDERKHAAAVKALVGPSVAPWLVFDYDEVPGANYNQGQGVSLQEAPPMFVQLAVVRRPNSNLRAVAATTGTGWRIQLRHVGSTVDECRWLAFYAAKALNEARIVVDGFISTRIQAEPSDPPAWDEGRYSSVAEWVYAL